ncbi:hypothetical protein CLF_111404 [Clonorchis sinensis]|uniref:Pol-related protein n=1 Tax=Clonorchis sinensis TaxID=79923 RepID=G7YUT4_CLOSI|nr:hypothetical protein CLF_111404 [Clonorchis sinensis]
MDAIIIFELYDLFNLFIFIFIHIHIPNWNDIIALIIYLQRNGTFGSPNAVCRTAIRLATCYPESGLQTVNRKVTCEYRANTLRMMMRSTRLYGSRASALTLMLLSSLLRMKSAQKAFAVLRMIRRTFSRITRTDFQILYGAYVRPLLEYADPVVYSGRTKDVILIGRVQRVATEMVAGLKSMDYETRLAVLDLFPLEYHRLRGDLILTYALFGQGLANRFFTVDPANTRRGHVQNTIGRTKDVILIERVQRAATKMVAGLKSMDYETRLAVLGPFPLVYRRLRGDLILTYALFEQGLANRFFTVDPANTRRGHVLVVNPYNRGITDPWRPRMNCRRRRHQRQCVIPLAPYGALPPCYTSRRFTLCYHVIRYTAGASAATVAIPLPQAAKNEGAVFCISTTEAPVTLSGRHATWHTTCTNLIGKCSQETTTCIKVRRTTRDDYLAPIR